MLEGITLESIGLTQEELQQRLIRALVDELLFDLEEHEDSEFRREAEKQVGAAIVARVGQIADAQIVPRIGELIDGTVLQETNKWGEARGEPMTFTEYLVNRAEAYLSEPVDMDGKTREETSFPSSRPGQTRVTYLIDRYLKYTIETAMQAAVKNANDAIAEGLAETCKIKLGEIAKALKVTVEVPK